jgi:hypothetical protein
LINGGRVDCFVGEGVDDLGDVEVRFAFRVDLEQLAGSVTEKFVQTDLKKKTDFLFLGNYVDNIFPLVMM